MDTKTKERKGRGQLPDRPQERLRLMGAASLSDAELLAILLQTGNRDSDALALASRLLDRFEGLPGALSASGLQLAEQRGIGATAAARIAAAWELHGRIQLNKVRNRDVMSSSSATRSYLMTHFYGYEREVFAALFLNNQHHVIVLEELFQGTIDGAAVYPREVVKRCLFHNAAAIIFVHNHPSGVPEPSDADVKITKKLLRALDTIEIRVLDHFVVGGGSVVSLAERGLL